MLAVGLDLPSNIAGTFRAQKFKDFTISIFSVAVSTAAAMRIKSTINVRLQLYLKVDLK